MKKLRQARKALRKCKLLSTIEDNMPANLTKTQQAIATIRYADWLGMDFCTTCNLQQEHCSCDFAIFDAHLPRLGLHREYYDDLQSHKRMFETQSGTEPVITTFTVLPSDAEIPKSMHDYRKQRVQKMREELNVIATPKSRKVYKPQSGVVPDDLKMAPIPEENGTNIATFADQDGGVAYDNSSMMDPSRGEQDDPNTYLGDWFKRPVLIHTQVWGTGAALTMTIDPWSLYFESPFIAPKLEGFNLLRCNLHLKIVVNGNGFQYGRALVNYLPLAYTDDFSSNAFLINADAVQASQQQHLYLNPTTSTGGEMILPFFFPENNLNVPDKDWELMGLLYARDLNTLKHANAASDKCTISIFAWAENVTTSGVTWLTAQSGTEVDEANANGIISGPATAIAKVANSLSKVPVIGKYARATAMMSNTTAQVARLFGYSRPCVTLEPAPYRPNTVGNMATCTVPDSAAKLTVDDKQELSIDPMIAGSSSGDPLAIRNIATRESYFNTFLWQTTNATFDPLWNCRVTPCLFRVSGTAPNAAFHVPACGAAALPFKYWSGTMRFRFQFVCSAYHKGRVQISYDANIGNFDTEYAVTYNRIVDISQETDVTVAVSPNQTRPFLECVGPGQADPDDYYGTTPFSTQLSEFANGVISITVLNELTTPNSSIPNDIDVNVFISMDDDFEVAVPSDYIQSLRFKPQSGLEGVDGFSDVREMPQNTEVHYLNARQPPDENRSLVFFGEKIVSFRTLLKRYSHWKRVGVTTGTANLLHFLKYRHYVFPYHAGNVGNPVDTTAAATPYNYCNTLPLHIVCGGFVGWRGALRYKVIQKTSTHTGMSSIAINRINTTLGDASYFQASAEVTPPTTAKGWHRLGCYDFGAFSTPLVSAPEYAMNGSVVQNSSVNASSEAEIPFYSPLRFAFARLADLTSFSVFPMHWDLNIAVTGGISRNSCFDIYVATGEDFQVYQWVGMPRLYFEENIPA